MMTDKVKNALVYIRNELAKLNMGFLKTFRAAKLYAAVISKGGNMVEQVKI
jgi:outer membrane protein assembly factor BamD (BamD/ComL family)